MMRCDDNISDIALRQITIYSLGLHPTWARCPICLGLIRPSKLLKGCVCGALMTDAGSAFFYDERQEWIGVRWVYDEERIFIDCYYPTRISQEEAIE